MGKDQELLEAARKGDVAIVEKILGQRAKRSGPLASLRRSRANVQDQSGYSALHHASLNGHRDIVRLLLDHDASTNIVDVKGSSPLHLAAWSGNVDIVKLLLSGPSICNVNLTTKDDETALHCAAQYGHTTVVNLLLLHKCDPGIRNCRGETALDLAAQYGRLDTVELLVRMDPSLQQCLRRAAPDIVYPHTPLHLASRNGHRTVVEVLLRTGFSVNMRTKAGTALHEAALCGKVEVARTLLEHGVSTNIRNCNNYTVMDLLGQFDSAQASQEIMSIIKRYRRGLSINDSDGESISHPFPTVQNADSDLGSPYENVRPSSKNARSLTTDPSPGTSPLRWDYQRHTRPPDGFEDRRVSGFSGISMSNSDLKDVVEDDDYVCMSLRNVKTHQSLPIPKRISHNKSTLERLIPLDGIMFSFTEDLSSRRASVVLNDSLVNIYDDNHDDSASSRESDNSLYQIAAAPKAFMDTSAHSEDFNYLCTTREPDQISLSSTASSCGYPKRPDSGGTPLYIPMNCQRGAYSPGSNNSKISPTPPKKPPRRNISISPTHLQPMSMSVDGAYEYVFLTQGSARSQGNLNDIDHTGRRLGHGRSVDQYVEMNVFNIALDENADVKPKELHRGKSEDLDNRKRQEPIAITSVYENTVIKHQNPRRKLRRNPEVYEEHEPTRKSDEPNTSSSAPSSTFVSKAFLMISDEVPQNTVIQNQPKPSIAKAPKINYPLSPTHYMQPPTPEHPPPNANEAETLIFEKIRPLSQEYNKRLSKDMETETEEEYLFVFEESSGSFSSSVSLSDKSVDNVIEEYHSDAPFAGLIKGSARVLETINTNTPVERPKTLKKLKRVYDHSDGEGLRSDNEKSSSSERESENKENKERVSALSPFDEQEEWAKIQEIMASFGTGIVRESVFVAELEKEFQNRLMTLSTSQNSLNMDTVTTIEKWLEGLEMGDYIGLFTSNGFDDVNFMNGVLEEGDLNDMGITSELERQIILDAVKQLPFKVNDFLCNNNNVEQNTVGNWLKRIHLEQYSETFAKHLYHDMERIKRIWDVELSAVLDIDKIGHRKRILVSVSSGEHVISGPKLDDINCDTISQTSKNETSNKELKSPSAHSITSSNTGTIRHRRKKSKPAPPPPVISTKIENSEKKPGELIVGGNNSIKSQWKHQPMLLITGVIKYSSNYLGSATIYEFKGTESTKKSIQKLRKTNEHPSQQISLSISYRGIKFLNPISQNAICEHEIRNVNCACQDSEDRCYFAYITKDGEHFYCHVFQATSPIQATDIILTLGQAFELAYQMALREQVTSKSKAHRGDNSHKPAVSPGAVSSHSRDFKDTPTRSDLKLNGHPLKMKPLTLSIAAEPLVLEPSKQRTQTKLNSGDNHG